MRNTLFILFLTQIMKKRDLLIVILAIIIGFGIGYFIFRNQKPAEIIVEKVIEDTHKIDSLNLIIKENEATIENLKDSVREKIVYIEKRVDEIKELPIDKNLEVLRDNLLVYGESFKVTDTLPALCQVGKLEDTLILMSEENLVDINLTFIRYEGTLEINNYLNQTIKADSSIISLKNSIILEKDEALERQRLAFESNMQTMDKIIAKERRKQVYFTVGGAFVAGALVYLLVK